MDQPSNSLCILLLAGGIGSRLGTAVPKQFLTLQGKPLVLYSFELFGKLPEVIEIVVVCAPAFWPIFDGNFNPHIKVTHALPGNRRQDSVYNGLKAMQSQAGFICIHDAARPFITQSMVANTIAGAKTHGAAAAAVRVKSTLKESNASCMVINTPDRSHFWEVQTPQVIKKELLEQGFAYALENNLTVTDDVSLIELLNLPVQLTEGSYRNIKITTPEDLIIAHAFLGTK